MKRVTPLETSAIEQALLALPGWRYENAALVRDYRFRDFQEAMAFILRVSYLAEAQQHHPVVHNVYASVTLSLQTHDAGNTVTERDVALAKAIQSLPEASND